MLILGVALAASALATPAAASEDENSLSIELGYATYSAAEYMPHGGVLAAAFARGISDALSWRLDGGLGGYYRDGFTASVHATAGLVYRFDVLKYVPYLHLGLGGIATAGPDRDAGASALVAVGAGLDVLRSRETSWGVYARFETLLQETAFFTAGVRASWRWGFF
ncbi:hypothetical protein Hoch_3728 [Haliangium ochraceum DSM 14365]|uniref:Outer membrane protein beta-barrel domain-containing protein n=2 Tax=Haliangium ochraceum TaxID=80816 RepID=D0LY78_HALO1|nr:hypothetical protein Hoch_3728 [Haliangium ochraceum DSM 14365]